MSENRNVRVDNKVKVDTNSDLFKFVMMMMIVAMAINMAASRKISEKANDLRKQQLEVAKKQYTLDSLRYYAPVKQR